jgi:hypothetical protein
VTEPQERELARQKAEAALENAVKVRSRGAKIAEGWSKSRQDNNFRQMLRSIAVKAESSAN